MKKSGKDLKPILRREIWDCFSLVELPNFDEMLEGFTEFKQHTDSLLEIMRKTLISMVNYLRLADAKEAHNKSQSDT